MHPSSCRGGAGGELTLQDWAAAGADAAEAEEPSDLMDQPAEVQLAA